MIKELVERDAVAYEFRHFPLTNIHPLAAEAARAAECAKDHFWQVADALFVQQRELSRDRIFQIASGHALSMADFTSCFEGAEPRQLVRDQDEAKRLNVSATPTFFIGRRQGGRTVEIVRKISGRERLRLRSSAR